MANGIRRIRVQLTPEEGRRTYQPKRCGINNKDDDNSPKILNDKNHQASSRKFWQHISLFKVILCRDVRELYSLYIYIYILAQLFLIVSFFCVGSNQIRIIHKQIYLTHRCSSNRYNHSRSKWTRE